MRIKKKIVRDVFAVEINTQCAMYMYSRFGVQRRVQNAFVYACNTAVYCVGSPLGILSGREPLPLCNNTYTRRRALRVFQATINHIPGQTDR